jgi:hypothetical protein
MRWLERTMNGVDFERYSVQMPCSSDLNSFMSSTSWSLMSLIINANFGTDTKQTRSERMDSTIAE